MTATCPVSECESSATSRGFCRNHYAAWYRLNGSRVKRKQSKSVEERFWSKVDTSDECWTWTAGVFKSGYGSFSISQSSTDYAHRVSYEMANGAIPAGLSIDHMCRNRICVNPDHLRAVTFKQNSENLDVRIDNTSGIRGVFWDKQTQRWRGLVGHNGKSYSVGRFHDLDECAEAVRLKRLELFTHNEIDKAS